MLPAWCAVIEQLPTARMVRVLPETEHTATVVEEKLTGRLELAVATIVNGAVPKPTLLNGPKVMVWEPSFTKKLWLTEGAAR